MREKIAVFAPIPSANVSTQTDEKTGRPSNIRMLRRSSLQNGFTGLLTPEGPTRLVDANPPRDCESHRREDPFYLLNVIDVVAGKKARDVLDRFLSAFRMNTVLFPLFRREGVEQGKIRLP